MTDAHVLSKRNISGCFDIHMIIYSNVLANYYIVILLIDRVNNIVKSFSFFSNYKPFLRWPVNRSLLGLKILKEQMKRREAGILSLAINTLLFPDLEVSRSIHTLSIGRKALHMIFIFWQGLRLLLGTLVTFNALIRLRINLSVDHFRLWLFTFEGLFHLDTLVVLWFQSAIKVASFDKPQSSLSL